MKIFSGVFIILILVVSVNSRCEPDLFPTEDSCIADNKCCFMKDNDSDPGSCKDILQCPLAPSQDFEKLAIILIVIAAFAIGKTICE